MQNKPTDDLQNELMSEPSFDSYMNENRPFFSQQSVAELLTALYEQQDISKAALARKAGMSEVYLHQVFAGRRNPSRDRLLCLCVGLGVTLEETQRLLKQASYAQLYPKIKRDAIISYGIAHHTSLEEINDHLFEGRYSPKWPDGKKHARNVYAHTREECEEKLKVLIVEMKAEIAEAKRLMDLGEGEGRPLEEKGKRTKR